jgi:AraC-like DNA-binding protein
VLRTYSPTSSEPCTPFGGSYRQSRLFPLATTKKPAGPRPRGNRWDLGNEGDRSATTSATDGDKWVVQISPTEGVKRHSVSWRGVRAEVVQSASLGKTEFRFRAPRHLLVAYEQGSRSEGETFVKGLPRSARREMARKLTLIPADHEYHEWHELRTPVRLIFFHFDLPELQAYPEAGGDRMPPLSPRIFFEDQTLWGTILKLRSLLDTPAPENQLYLEALGLVLVHELARLDGRRNHMEHHVSGGLAAWQQRIVTAYIDEHLGEHISLATLAQLARLSPYHFCRAFKQSFGQPPHRYHTRLRIERAKALLEKRPVSVTEIGMSLGFSDTSSFTTAFRKATGLTPTVYHRRVA